MTRRDPATTQDAAARPTVPRYRQQVGRPSLHIYAYPTGLNARICRCRGHLFGLCAVPRRRARAPSIIGRRSGQQTAGVPGVDLAHVTRIRRRVRGQGGADVAHEDRRGGRGPDSQHQGIGVVGLLKPCRCPQAATNMEPAAASCGSLSPATSRRPRRT